MELEEAVEHAGGDLGEIEGGRAGPPDRPRPQNTALNSAR